MKNKLSLIIIILMLSSNCSFAIQEGKVISEDNTKKQVIDAFADLNQYTDNFFTPPVKKVVDQDEIDKDNKKNKNAGRGSIPPVKRLRLMLQNKSNKTGPKEAAVEEVISSDQAILDCDNMEYFADRTELEANGHVVMFFPKNNSTIKADRVVYNQTSNLIKAFDNVVLISDGKEMFGDYMKIDMNEENGYMDNPASDAFQIRARAKKGYMYGDKIVQEQGSLYVKKKTIIRMISEEYGPDLERMYIDEKDRGYYKREGHGDKFKIKTNDLIINSKKEHETVTLKHAEIYINDKKVGTIPSITVHTNKAQDYIEANYPEFGTMTNLGAYAGPGFVLDTPGGTTLKLLPIVNYQGNGNDSGESSLGFGGIAKFKSASNKTDMYYGTANKMLLVRGKQKLDDNLYLQYGTNTYMDDWFMGFRLPKLLGELVYQDSFANKNFIGINRDMTFTHRIAAGYIQDGDTSRFDGVDGIGTMRFKYMAEVAQNLYKYSSETESPINARLDLVGQTSAAVYGTGNTQMVARVGPRLHTQYKNWMQDVGYFLSGYDDKTPLLMFDRYMYGRSNAYMRETLRLNKYLALSWFGSLNLLKDSWDGKMIQENAFFLSFGPDDIKFHFGYDTIRQQTFFTMELNMDAKGSTLEYKKMVIKNPERIGKDKNGNKPVTQAFSPSSGITDVGFIDEDGFERAEVTDIKEAL